jgi:hypothetical protein
MADGWKRFQELLVVRNDSGHLGLLEHDLRDPDGIGITGSSPGEVSAVLLKPIKQTPLDSLYSEDGYH